MTVVVSSPDQKTFTVEDHAHRDRAAQGLPTRITDPAALSRIATLITTYAPARARRDRPAGHAGRPSRQEAHGGSSTANHS